MSFYKQTTSWCIYLLYIKTCIVDTCVFSTHKVRSSIDIFTIKLEETSNHLGEKKAPVTSCQPFHAIPITLRSQTLGCAEIFAGCKSICGGFRLGVGDESTMEPTQQCNGKCQPQINTCAVMSTLD